MFDEEDGEKKKTQLEGLVKDLEPMSLDELDKYIVDLNDEITRAQDEIKRKKVHMEAASSVFKN